MQKPFKYMTNFKGNTFLPETEDLFSFQSNPEWDGYEITSLSEMLSLAVCPFLLVRTDGQGKCIDLQVDNVEN